MVIALGPAEQQVRALSLLAGNPTLIARGNQARPNPLSSALR